MSTITKTKSVSLLAGPDWVPSHLYRITLEQYEAMIASGAFNKRDRVQLINGYLVAKMTELPAHGAAWDAIHLTLEPLLPLGWYVRTERVIRIPNYASMPEPDVVVVRGNWRDYANRYPEPADIAMVVEVASSSLYEDRMMAVHPWRRRRPDILDHRPRRSPGRGLLRSVPGRIPVARGIQARSVHSGRH